MKRSVTFEPEVSETRKSEAPHFQYHPAGMRLIPIITRGKWRICCDERDVQDVCSTTRCGEDPEECVRLMRDGSFECHLCLVMLRSARKSFTIMGRRDYEISPLAHVIHEVLKGHAHFNKIQ